MVSAKMGNVGHLKIRALRNKFYDVIISVYDITNKFYLVIQTYRNLGLSLGMALKYYTSVAKRSKLNVRKFFRLVSTFVEVTRKKLVGEGLFDLTPHPLPLRLK